MEAWLQGLSPLHEYQRHHGDTCAFGEAGMVAGRTLRPWLD